MTVPTPLKNTDTTTALVAAPPTPHPTAWKSIPGFIRFAAWLASIVTVVWLFVLPVLVIATLLSGGLTSLLYGAE